MLYRNKKKNDINLGKWIGIGGHIEKNETKEEALCREVLEETNLYLNNYTYRGIVDFYMDSKFYERTHVFISSDYTGTLSECNEGELKYISLDNISTLNLWEGDMIFLDILFKTNDFFELELYYIDDKLVRSVRKL